MSNIYIKPANKNTQSNMKKNKERPPLIDKESVKYRLKYKFLNEKKEVNNKSFVLNKKRNFWKNKFFSRKKNELTKKPSNYNNTKRMYNNYNDKTKIYNIIMIIFLIYLNFSYALKQGNIYSFSSSITITLRGTGLLSIFYGGDCEERTFNLPDIIYINGVKKLDISDKYQFTKSPNFVKLEWNNINNNCNCLFKDCTDIVDIDFSEFDFTFGLAAKKMFYNCKSLTSIDLYSYGKIKFQEIAEMFSYCESLIYIDTSQFDISGLSDTHGMFRGCHSLISLDLSSFRNSYLKYGQYMFYDCPNLMYVNLINAHYCTSGNNVTNFLSGTKNIVFCTNCVDIKPIVKDYECAINDCSDHWRESQKKINLENSDCVIDCSETVNNKYLYESRCYATCPDGTYKNDFLCENCHSDCKTCDKPPENGSSNCKSCKSPDKILNKGNCIYECPNGFYYDENSVKVCKCDLKKCSKCSEESKEKNLCIICNYDEKFYPKENDINNINTFIDCYQSVEGHYLDKNNTKPIYRLCYESCTKCNIGGNNEYHNCVECKSDYYFELPINEYKNCYKKCPYYYYHDKNINKYYCTKSLECPQEYSKLIYEKSECIYKCEEDDEYKYEFRKRCYKQCPEYTRPNGYICELVCPEEKPFEMVTPQVCVKYCSIQDLLDKECILNYKSDDEDYEQKAHNIMIRNAEHGYISEEYNITHLEKGEEDIIEFWKINITLSTINKQKISKNPKIIDLKGCEATLRKKYEIPDSEDLFIKKIDVVQYGMKIPKIE